MSVNESKKTSFPIILGVLLVFSIIGGLTYYFITNKPSEEPTQEVIKSNQETEKQEEIVIINNEYIPVIDNLWLNIPAFLIITVVSFVIAVNIEGKLAENKISIKLQEKGFKHLSHFFGTRKDEKETVLIQVQFSIGFIIIFQVITYIIWFILILIFTAFSKIWDKEHSWWSNFNKGFFRNRIHRGWLSLIPILLPIIAIIVFVLLKKFVF